MKEKDSRIQNYVSSVMMSCDKISESLTELITGATVLICLVANILVKEESEVIDKIKEVVEHDKRDKAKSEMTS